MSAHDLNNIYDRFSQVMKQTKELVASMEQLQAQVTAVMEKNAELSIENDHLRTLLRQSQNNTNGDHLSGSRENLKQLYQQGFHVCSEYFGKRLDNHESCTFCIDAIFGHDREGLNKQDATNQ